jgi:hypothetical protein
VAGGTGARWWGREPVESAPCIAMRIRRVRRRLRLAAFWLVEVRNKQEAPDSVERGCGEGQARGRG